MKKLSEIGHKFGRLTVLSELEKAGKQRQYLCICDCGGKKVVQANNLRRGLTKSCGCLRKEMSKGQIKHGLAGTPAYITWKNMMARCHNVKSKCYARYGGKGVYVCERWHSFEAFFLDMGHPKPGMSIDRIDPAGNYDPSNCRWATSSEQARNKRNTRFETFRGITAPLADHCDRMGLDYKTVHRRITLGWPASKALSEPIARPRPNPVTA